MVVVQDVPKRDRIAKELADKNSRYYRERKQKALIQVLFLMVEIHSYNICPDSFNFLTLSTIFLPSCSRTVS